MVLYFTGTGNSRYLARRIAERLEMPLYDLNACIKAGNPAPVQTGRDVVLVTPTYAWRIPRVVSEWLGKTTLTGAERIWFVMDCGSEIGNAAKYNRSLAEQKQLHYMVGEHFAGKGIDALYCVGTLSQEITKAVRANSSATEVHHYEDKADLIKDLVKEVKSGDTVLVKASHFMGFPEIVKELTK